MGSTKRDSVLDARSASRRGENRPEAIRINPTLSANLCRSVLPDAPKLTNGLLCRLVGLLGSARLQW